MYRTMTLGTPPNREPSTEAVPLNWHGSSWLWTAYSVVVQGPQCWWGGVSHKGEGCIVQVGTLYSVPLYYLNTPPSMFNVVSVLTYVCLMEDDDRNSRRLTIYFLLICSTYLVYTTLTNLPRYRVPLSFPFPTIIPRHGIGYNSQPRIPTHGSLR
ncbi:hypothetical protein F5Y09DRAFT_221641 [Xylaria sp. FL1042]|nr:hypothetical protein F5Y09DRAFT_221641 [Xylaria sp. FL1042]